MTICKTSIELLDSIIDGSHNLDVQATWKSGILEMKITFSEDLPFGEFACVCNGKRMVYHYLYRLCSIEEVIQHEASFQPSINQSCFAVFDPSTNKTAYGYKLTKEACDKSHLYPASSKSKNYANHTICDGSSSFTLCHSISKEFNDKVPRKTQRTNVVTTDKNLCQQTYEGFPLYSILHSSSLVNPSESCDSILKSPLKQFLEPINLDVPVRIMTERSKFCFLAPEIDKKNSIFIDLTVSKNIRKSNVELWQQITHSAKARMYDIDIVRKIDQVYETENIKVECRRSKDQNTVPFTRSVVRL
uniref:Uncharacterized protein n=1 Tax=Romanomermis culicivorax TaxID=13658 RepID=A0A915IB29_ROMCU